mgnify:CR=1 FL=1
MSVQRPESRYGRQARSPRSRRRIAIALGVLALAAGVTVAVIGYQRLGTSRATESSHLCLNYAGSAPSHGCAATRCTRSAHGAQKPLSVATVPIVIHVVYSPGTPIGTAENLSDADVQAGLALLNQAFAGVSCNSNPDGEPVGIQFALAKRDAKGNPTSGITRHASSATTVYTGGWSNVMLTTVLDGNFPTTDYVNVWLVKEFCYFIQNGQCFGPQGVSTLAGSHGGVFDGAIIEAGASHAPLVVLTADRPFELQGCAAPQTIDQIKATAIDMVNAFSHAGIASRMFQALAREGINIRMISTSEIKISVVIDEKYLELGVRTLHEAFQLDQAPAA